MAADLPVPTYTNLNEAYPDLVTAAREAARFNDLAIEYTKRFGHPPTHIARAPGRVNLIGEHVDYALFGVLPTAVERDVLIACGKRPEGQIGTGEVRAENLDTKYTPQTFRPDPSNGTWHLPIDKSQLRWESYIKAGYYGVLNQFFDPFQTEGALQPTPVDLLFTGTVPAGSGLSSSAAMVVASTLAFLAVNDKLHKDGQGTRKGELVEMAVENEKRVGVNSGGMDQAASVISLPTSALYISFFPVLHAESILLPITRTVPRAVFVCANSLVVSDKVVGAKTRYNLRVVEVLVAARILARLLSLSFISGAPASKPTLREVLGAYINARIHIPGSEVLETNEVRGQASPALSVEQLEDGLGRLLGECEVLRASKLVGRVGGEEGLTMEEMVEASGLSKEVFEEVYLSWVDVEATHFQLYKRAKHVFSEALRVLQFRKLCLSVSGSSEEGDLPESTLKDLGALMDASQESCSELFECSCPELNRLTTIAREAGAYGSRLTGAGWGGCTVSLVAENDVEGFISRVKAAYPPYRDLEGERLSEVIFATKPSGGAFVYKLEE